MTNKMTIALKKIIDDEYKLHPFATLIDYYKLVFQATFGPAHILKNKDVAYQVLVNEISLLEDRKDANIQDLSFMTDFMRVDLQLVEKIKMDNFWAILLKSADIFFNINKEGWLNIWSEAENYLSNFTLKNFEKDKMLLTSKVENVAPVHHSDIYKTNYNPHYRVVSKGLWQRLSKNG